MPETLRYTGSLTICSCWCGIRMAVPDDLYKHAQRGNGRNIYCPLGHSFIFSDNDEKRLAQAQQEAKRARLREEATRELLEHETNSHRATRGHVTRLKKRVAAGVCPCCNRSFKDLARHMQGQHPDYVK
jgi:hypothetical protein